MGVQPGPRTIRRPPQRCTHLWIPTLLEISGAEGNRTSVCLSWGDSEVLSSLLEPQNTSGNQLGWWSKVGSAGVTLFRLAVGSPSQVLKWVTAHLWIWIGELEFHRLILSDATAKISSQNSNSLPSGNSKWDSIYFPSPTLNPLAMVLNQGKCNPLGSIWKCVGVAWVMTVIRGANGI